MQDALVKPISVKYATITISPEFLLKLITVPKDGLRVGDNVIRPGSSRIPEDAKALRCGLDDYGRIVLIIESDEFDEVFEGEKLPSIMPIYDETPVHTNIQSHMTVNG